MAWSSFVMATLAPSSVVSYYLGNEAAFQSPRTYQGLLEVSHFHLFAMGMLLLVLTHLMLFVPVSGRTKAWLIAVPFLAGFENAIGILIIGFALYQAWTMTQKREVAWGGPFQVGSAAGPGATG